MTGDKTRRRSAGSLLVAERTTRIQLSQAVDSSIDGAVATATRQRGADRPHKAVLLAGLIVAGRSLALAASSALSRSRLIARTTSAERLRVELAAIGATAAAAAIASQRSDRGHEDAAYADSAGASLAAAWQGLAVVAASKAVRLDKDVAKALDATRAPMKYRVDRTAATETAAAYNDEHRRALDDAAARDPAVARGISDAGLGWAWDAALDKRTCENCERMDGQERGPDEEFPGGDPPLHGNCRCILFMTTLTRGAAQAA